MQGLGIQFEWDRVKAEANVRKHGVAFQLATTIFSDARILTLADLEHGHSEDWFSVGCASDGAILAVAYLWSEAGPLTTMVRIISARKATRAEMRHYYEGKV